MPGSKHTHGSALDVQMSSWGRNPSCSSRDGKRIDVKAGFDAPRVNRGVSHWAQKLRVVAMPLLARTAWAAGVPVTWRSALRTTTPEANAAPLERWQSVQWQLSMATGAVAQVKRTAPHAHPPEIGSFMVSLVLMVVGQRLYGGRAAWRRHNGASARRPARGRRCGVHLPA